jgi:hypothetical protein
MPKNPYLIENKKPVELVQELKDYEIKKSPLSPAARSKVIKKWGGGYVSEDKEGYGPCYYANSDCTCYISQEFVTLNLACPACSNRTPSVWIHRSNDCGGSMYISTSVHLKCMRCSEDGHWREWSFGCSEHKGYKKAASGRAFLDAMNLALALYPSNDRVRDIVKEISIRLIREC